MEGIRTEIRIFGMFSHRGMETLKDHSKEIINQLAELAGRLSDEQYTKELPVLLGHSIGKHFRHILEFYKAMLEGSAMGVVNYDQREHDLGLEKKRDQCIEQLRMLGSGIESLSSSGINRLAGSYSLEEGTEFSVPTNAGRELVYNIEHAIHHMAIIRIAVQHEFPRIELKQDFGYAISTLKHLKGS